jgi:hypothetical protein
MPPDVLAAIAGILKVAAQQPPPPPVAAPPAAGDDGKRQRRSLPKDLKTALTAFSPLYLQQAEQYGTVRQWNECMARAVSALPCLALHCDVFSPPLALGLACLPLEVGRGSTLLLLCFCWHRLSQPLHLDCPLSPPVLCAVC